MWGSCGGHVGSCGFWGGVGQCRVGSWLRGPWAVPSSVSHTRAHGADIKDLSHLCSGGVEEGGPRLGAGPWSARPHQGSRLRSDFAFQPRRQPQARAQAAGSRRAAPAWQACPEPLMEQCRPLRPRLSRTIQKGGGGKIGGGGGARAPCPGPGLGGQADCQPWVGQHRGRITGSRRPSPTQC